MQAIRPLERVLITGGTGSLGTHLIETLSEQRDVQVRVFSRDEKKQYDLRLRFPQVEYRLGDIRDRAAVRAAVRDVDVVIHAASLKYVDVSERQPTEYVLTNTLGTINLIEAVLNQGNIRRCVGISSDKACRPVNTYGLTKALLEKLFCEAALLAGPGISTEFNVARYGNVVGTRGSVIPFWQKCRQEGRPLPVTDPEMTRFFFTLNEAIDLIDFTLTCPRGVVVSKRMSAARLGDVAKVMQMTGVEVLGRRPGEKTHEELLSAEEMGRTISIDDKYFVYDPEQKDSASNRNAYTSQVAAQLTQEELKILLEEYLR